MQNFIHSFQDSVKESKHMSPKALLKASMKELKNTKVLCVLGMLGALSLILYRLSFTVMGIQLGFDPVCNLLASCLFGPAVGAIFGGAMDLLNWVFNGTGAYLPGMTLNAILSGIFIGLVFYKRKLTPVKMIIIFLIDHFIFNTILGSYWLYQLFPGWIIANFLSRVISNLIKPFLETFIILSIYRQLVKSNVLQTIRQPIGHKK